MNETIKEKFEINFEEERIVFDLEINSWGIKSICYCQKTSVLGTFVFKKVIYPEDKIIFQVNFEEKYYATEKTFNNQNERETKTNNEIITSRLIDRSIRNFFSEDLGNSIQINNYLLSFDKYYDYKILALLNSELMCFLSEKLNMPDPITSIKINLNEKEKTIYNKFLEDANDNIKLEAILTASKRKVTMLDAFCREINEIELKEKICIAWNKLKKINNFFNKIKLWYKIKKYPLIIKKETAGEKNLRNFESEIKEIIYGSTKWRNKEKKLESIIQTKIKQIAPSQRKLFSIKEETKKKDKILSEIIKNILINKSKRIDGRDLKEIRQINIVLNSFPSITGNNVIFSRGDTEILSVTTLETINKKQTNNNITKETKEAFFFHNYNFLPYSVGEISKNFYKNKSRRETGHSELIRKTFISLLPKKEKFPFIIRTVSEVLSSNGSSSQASICAASISLIISKVPLTNIAVGITIGFLYKKIIVDITEIEDKFSEMDFKIAGTKKGICSIQLDTKKEGIEEKILEKALKEGRNAHFKILKIIEEKIKENS